MLPHRRTALIAGALYLVTVATSIPALALKSPALANPASLTTETSIPLVIAGLLEIVLAVACVGTAVVLLPVIRRVSEPASLGFLSGRIVEAALITVGVISMLALLGMPRYADADSLAHGVLVGLHDGAFLLGPGLIPVTNALCLGYVLYRSSLVPRVIPLVGLIGAPLLLASTVATLFGVLDQVSPLAGLAALPIALWEISLGVWLVIAGFRPAAVDSLALPERADVA